MTEHQPAFLLFIQHGLSDSDQPFLQLAQQLPIKHALVQVPQLDILRTWFRIEPLIDTVEHQAATLLKEYPDTPVRIIGHSMGGLIWLELLGRQPLWRTRIRSIVLLATPVAGANLARGVDPFGWGIGIARDLSRDRRPLAEEIAATVPLLTILGGADSIVAASEARIAHVPFVTLPRLSHTTIRDHWMTARVIQCFWEGQLDIGATRQAIALLHGVPTISEAHTRDLPRAQVTALLTDAGTLHTWTNPLGFLHAFIVDREGQVRFGGFVWPQHTPLLQQAIEVIKQQWGEAQE